MKQILLLLLAVTLTTACRTARTQKTSSTTVDSSWVELVGVRQIPVPGAHTPVIKMTDLKAMLYAAPAGQNPAKPKSKLVRIADTSGRAELLAEIDSLGNLLLQCAARPTSVESPDLRHNRLVRHTDTETVDRRTPVWSPWLVLAVLIVIVVLVRKML